MKEISLSGHAHSQYSLTTHNHNNLYYTKSELDEMISPILPPYEGVLALGNVITMSDMEWRVVHVDEDAGECVLAKEYHEEYIQFDSSGKSNVYAGSTLANKCNSFYNTLKPSVQRILINKKTHGVDSKVWAPQINWISSTDPKPGTPSGSWTGSLVFKYFSVDIADRIYKDKDGTKEDWWTASASVDEKYNDMVYFITMAGGVFSVRGISGVGFRPFCCIPL